MTTTATLSDWVKPSPNFTEVKDYVTKRDGAKDTIEGVINVFEWMSHLGYNKEFADKAADQLNPVKQTLAIPGFVESLGTLRDKWRVLNASDAENATTDFTQSVAISALQFCESAMAVDSWGIYPLKEGMHAAKTGFWGAAGVIDGISFFQQVSKADELSKQIEGIKNKDLKNVYEHKLQLAYLNVAKAASTIAMAGIALTSLLFASLAHGFLFQPVVFLTLASAWLILTYTTHFYGKMIDRWEKELPPGVR